MQECQLTKTQVVDTYHLDDQPGYKIGDDARAGCADTTAQLSTLTECENAKAALDLNADAVEEVNKTDMPRGCYRQKKEGYRFENNNSSYLWYFNTATTGKGDPKFAPVCKGKARQRCL